MAVVYPNNVKVARMNAVVTEMGSTSVLELGTAGMAVVVATIDLDATPGTVAGAGVLTLSGFPKSDLSADNAGTIAAARIRTSSGGSDVITGLTVGLSGTDVIVDNTNVAAGQQVNVNSAVLTHAT